MHRLSERAIDHPRLVLLGSLLLVLLGAAAIIALPKERTPRVRLPLVLVAIPNPGAQPLTNDVQIVRRIEDAAVGELDRLADNGAVQSSAVYGAALVQFWFEDGVNIRNAEDDVRKVVDRIKGEFPERARIDPGPTVDDVDFESFPIIEVFVSGGDIERRFALSRELKDRIELIPGVSTVDEFGRRDREVEVLIDPERLAQLNLGVADIERAVRSGNVDLPTGAIEGGGLERRVRFAGRFNSIEDMRSAPVAERDGAIIHLGDVANVRMGFEPPSSVARYGQAKAVVLQVRGQRDIDVRGTAITVQRAVDAFIADKNLPTGLEDDDAADDKVFVGYNRSQAREIQIMFNQLGSSAVFGMGLVVLVLAIFMGLRNALLISIAIPFSLIVAAAFMLIAKATFAPELAINNMSLFSLILVIGMVVDGALIVGENIHRNREMGRSPIDAAKTGIREVGTPVIIADLTTIAAFAPMYLVRGIMGDFMGTMPTVVIFALTASLLVDHFLLPVLSVYLLRARPRSEDESAPITEGTIDVHALEGVVRRSRTMQLYSGVMRYALHHRLLVLTLALMAIVTPVAMSAAGAIGFEFFPKSDNAQLDVYFELPLGSDMETSTLDVAKRVEAAVRRAVKPEEWQRQTPHSPRVQPTTTLGEVGALTTRLEAGQESGPEFGRVFVELTLRENRGRDVHEIARAIETELPEIPGVRYDVNVPSEGPPAGVDVLVRVLASDNLSLERLALRAAEFEQTLTEAPGATNVRSSHRVRPQLRATPRRDIAGFFGVTASDVGRSLSFALRGVEVADVDFGGDEKINVRIRNVAERRALLSDVRNLPIRTAAGKIVSLDQIADIERVAEPNEISRYDLSRVISISADLEDGVIADNVKHSMLAALGDRAAPQRANVSLMDHVRRFFNPQPDVIYRDNEITVEFGGENEIRDDAMADLSVALSLSIVLMFAILVLQFNSFIQPFVVLAAVPLSLIGVALGLGVTGLNFSIAAMIGVVALAGVVVNDGIVLVAFTNQLRSAGVGKKHAIVMAGQLRLRPVFLTTVTTIGGLMPLALNIAGGGEFWRPLTVSIIFGYAAATLLTLVLLPVGYYTFVSSRPSLFDPSSNAKFMAPSTRTK